jgi:hypothetical protein
MYSKIAGRLYIASKEIENLLETMEESQIDDAASRDSLHTCYGMLQMQLDAVIALESLPVRDIHQQQQLDALLVTVQETLELVEPIFQQMA